MADKTHTADFFAGFLVGALVGAAAALLFAPQSGEETRILIRDKGIELRDRADEMSAEARHRAAEMQTQARERAVELQTRVKTAVDEGRSAGAERKEELLSQVEEGTATDEALIEA